MPTRISPAVAVFAIVSPTSYSVAGEEQMYSLTRGRINRATYWLCLTAIAAIFAAILAFTDRRVPYGELVLIVLCVPRLHDIGRSGWWVGGVFIAEIAFTVGALVALPADQAVM